MEYNVVKQAVYCVTAISDCTVSCGTTVIATVSAGTQKIIVAIDDVLSIDGECVVTPVR